MILAIRSGPVTGSLCCQQCKSDARYVLITISCLKNWPKTTEDLTGTNTRSVVSVIASRSLWRPEVEIPTD